MSVYSSDAISLSDKISWNYKIVSHVAFRSFGGPMSKDGRFEIAENFVVLQHGYNSIPLFCGVIFMWTHMAQSHKDGKADLC